jgi:hypothetical protein
VLLPKPEPQRDALYLVWIQTLPCLCCQAWGGTRIDSHHMSVGGVGLKCSDHLVVPLCRRCHNLVQRKDWKALSEWGFTLATAWEGAARILAKYYEEKEKQKGGKMTTTELVKELERAIQEDIAAFEEVTGLHVKVVSVSHEELTVKVLVGMPRETEEV